MFGNILNNNTIRSLIEKKDIEIRPFDANKLKTCHYPLHPLAFLERQNNDTESVFHDFSKDQSDVEIAAGQYVIVEISEQLSVDKGIVGKFLPASQLIENGLMLLAGRVEFPFGQKGEKIRFGLHNASGKPASIGPKSKLAYVEFYDFRGLNNLPFELSEREMKLFVRRLARAQDDGPNYEIDY